MPKIIKVILLSLLTCIFIAAEGVCAELSGKKVLFVAGKDRLGDPVVSKVNASLHKKGAVIKMSSKTDLKGADAGRYDAILIFNPVRSGKTERDVRVFADESVQKKIVLFNAVGGRYWLRNNADESGKLAETIFAKIEEVLKK